MRLRSVLLAFAAFTFSLTPALAPRQAVAQLGAVPLICKGDLNIVRVSAIKPGMMSKFLEAVAAQKAWYKKAGTPDQISVMRVMVQDAATKAYSFSETETLTTHIEPKGRGKAPAHDAAYDAFVALFRESSDIKSEYFACMAKM